MEHGIHPRITTQANIDNMLRQLKRFGLSYDWDRELATIDPEYVRWTQWIFLQLFESWFDPRRNAARPIGELVERLERGELGVGEEGAPVENGGRPWSTLSAGERRAVIDGQRLAYLAEINVNWCPALGTVLANEEVTAEGRSERGNHPVSKRPLKQWMLRITAYAERLLADLDLVDWPEPIKLMQRNWIGRSEGALVDFALDAVAAARAGTEAPAIRVFTTRPDTLFGATYMVLAPEHPLAEALTTPAQRDAVTAYRAATAAKSEVDRQAEVKTKTGVFSGSHAINPVNGERIPVWIADYVLMGYGTGAIMAVPAHDQRDFEFATTFSLPIRAVLMAGDGWLAARAGAAGMDGAPIEALRARHAAEPAAFGEAFCDDAVNINSRNSEISLDGRPTPEAKRAITAWLAAKGLGEAKVQYKLRDWLFSRQRYWGEPFPILHGEDGEVRAVEAAELPVLLPEMEDFRPPVSEDPNAPPTTALSRAPESWRVVIRDGRRYIRELNTMPQWAGSCWYYLRFIDPGNPRVLVDPARERYFMAPSGVDLYVGGVEHAVLHLLYARFWHKVLYDLGHVSTVEPFGRLFNQGYILAHAYQDERGAYVDATKVEERDEGHFFEGRPLTRSYGKMGKSLKNAVTPDDIFVEYGCDTLRLYEMYMGPLETSKPWNTRDIVGVHRFLQRVFRAFVDEDSGTLRVDEAPAADELRRALHRTIKVVTDDMERMSFNTAIARLIELNNQLVGLPAVPREVAEPFVLMLAPLVPHLAEELWERLGHAESLSAAPWPRADERWLVEDTVEVVVQVSGKVRGRVALPAGADEAAARAAALADPAIAKHLEGKTVRKAIYVPGKLLNLVAG